MKNFTKIFEAEVPIEHKKEDLLDRDKFVEHLSDSILSWKARKSLTIGLFGEWGTGKSSIINLEKEHLGNKDEKERPIIVDFNPWSTSNDNNLDYHFFLKLQLVYRKMVLEKFLRN